MWLNIKNNLKTVGVLYILFSKEQLEEVNKTGRSKQHESCQNTGKINIVNSLPLLLAIKNVFINFKVTLNISKVLGLQKIILIIICAKRHLHWSLGKSYCHFHREWVTDWRFKFDPLGVSGAHVPLLQG